MDTCRRIPPGDLSRSVIRRRRCRLGFARRTAWLFGHEGVLNRLLHREVAKLAHQDHGFAVPSAWGVAACGEVLRIDWATGRLVAQLADWVGCGDRCWHLNDQFLGTGDWAPLLQPFADSPVAREADELYRCALDYRSTPAYAVLVKAVDEGRPVRRQQQLLSNRLSIDGYFERFVELFRSIQEHGVLPRHCLSGIGVDTDAEREVGVAIGRNGEVWRLPGGQHRTAIARVLGIASLPVEVRLIHAGWLLDVMNRNGCPPVRAIRIGLASLQ